MALILMVAYRDPDRHVPTVMRTHVGGTGEPWRGWGADGPNWIDAYVMRGDSHWQIVLSVEQLLNRSVAPTAGTDANASCAGVSQGSR